MKIVYTQFDFMDEVTKKLYRTWYNMKYRCMNPKAPNYRNYGGKGVYVSDRWMEFDTFQKDVRSLLGWDEEKFLQNKIVRLTFLSTELVFGT